VWQITEKDVEALASGGLLLGAGGGGEVWLAIPLVVRALREHGPVTVLDRAELPPGSHAVPVCGSGAPTVLYEKPPEGGEMVRAVREIEARSGIKADAIVGLVTAGIPSMWPVLAAAQLRLPLVDADAVGRSTTKLNQTMLAVAGIELTPMAFTNDKGSSFVVDGVDTEEAERVLRMVLPALGGWSAMVGRPMSTDEMDRGMLGGSFRMACDLGTLIRRNDRAELAARYGARTLFRGKVVEVQRRIVGQYPAGTVVVEHAEEPDRMMRIEMQNEYLVAMEDGRTVACVPDLICVLGHESGACLTTEHLRYGLWVEVLGIPCFPQWRSEAGLAVFGPRAFGYDLDYMPMDARV
jgi:uncharacterized protein